MRDPVAEAESNELHSLSPRLDGFDGKRIGIHTNTKAAAVPVATVVEEKLTKRYPDAEFVRCDVPGRDDEKLSRIAEWATEEADACITVVGDCGGCTRAVVRTTNAIEDAGVPAVGLVADGFEVSWETNAQDQGRYLRHQVLPIRSETTDIDVLRERVDEAVVDGIEVQLTEPLSEEERGETERTLLS